MVNQNLNPIDSVGRIDAKSSAMRTTPLPPDALILTIKQIPEHRAPGYHQIILNQHDSPFDSPVVGTGLIKKADWYNWRDSFWISTRITIGSPFISYPGYSLPDSL